MTKKKDLITQQEIDRLLKRVFDNNTNKSDQEQLLKLLQEMQIILDEASFEDSIDGTRIRVSYGAEIRRKGGLEGEQIENSVRFQYIREIPIDYSKVPISFGRNADTTTTPVSTNRINEDYIITESYDLLEEICPTLYEILGLL